MANISAIKLPNGTTYNLKDSINISSGNGTKDNPYILGGINEA